MNDQKRAAKRLKREKRDSKKDSWYCAGCKERHPFGTACPAPRLRAVGFNRAASLPQEELVD